MRSFFSETVWKEATLPANKMDTFLNFLSQNVFLVFIGLMVLVVLLVFLFGRSQEDEEGESRGAERDDELAYRYKKGRITIEKKRNIQIPFEYENRGHLIIGSSGTGKTQFLWKFLRGIEREKAPMQKVLIHDFKGDFTAHYGASEDIKLFSFIDRRAESWDFIGDIFNFTANPDIEFQQIAQTLIPPSKKEDFWNQGARQILTGCLWYLLKKDKRVNREFKKLVNLPGDYLFNALNSVREARKYAGRLKGIGDGDRTALSFHQTFQTTLSNFTSVLPDEGNFTINQFLDEEGDGFLILQNHPKYKEALSTCLALAFQTAIRKILSQEDVERTDKGQTDRQYWFFIDEFYTLGYMPSIGEALTNGRSKGICLLIGIQDFKSVELTYERAFSGQLRNNLNSWYIFRVNEPEDARTISQFLGEREEYRIKKTTTRGSHSGGQSILPSKSSSISRREEREVKPVVMESEITTLPDLKLFLKIPDAPVTRCEMEYQKVEKNSKSYEYHELGF